MRTETIGNIKVTLFDEAAHSREKNLVIVERLTETPTWIDVLWGIRYYFDQTDRITIDWSDVIRNAAGGEFNIYAETLEEFFFEYTVKQGKRPPLSISPCRNMIFGDGQKIEIIHNYSVFVFALVSGVWVRILYDLDGYNGSLEIPEGATMVKYRLNDLTAHNLFMEFLAGEPTPKQISDFLAAINYDTILLKPRSCNTRYELLKWTSAYGNEKRAWFEV